MAKKFLLVFLVLFTLVIVSFNANSQHEIEYKTKKANKNDILGTWEMTYQTVRPGIDTSSKLNLQ